MFANGLVLFISDDIIELSSGKAHYITLAWVYVPQGTAQRVCARFQRPSHPTPAKQIIALSDKDDGRSILVLDTSKALVQEHVCSRLGIADGAGWAVSRFGYVGSHNLVNS